MVIIISPYSLHSGEPNEIVRGNAFRMTASYTPCLPRGRSKCQPIAAISSSVGLLYLKNNKAITKALKGNSIMEQSDLSASSWWGMEPTDGCGEKKNLNIGVAVRQKGE